MGHMTIRRLLASLVLFISVLLSAHALAFDIGGVSYDVINTTEIVVTGRASGNTDMDIVIPATVSDSGTIYVVRTIGAYAFPNNALTSVVIPGSVTTIEGYAFVCNGLTSVIIGNDVTSTEFQAFGYNDLTDVTIPENVTSIGVADFFSTTSANSPITMSRLINGLTYLCLVSATNDAGTSTASELSAPFIRVAPAPGC